MVAASAAIGRWTSKRSTSVIPHPGTRAESAARVTYSRTSTARCAVATSWTHAPAMLGADRGAPDDRRRARSRRPKLAGPQHRLVATARRIPRPGAVDTRARGPDRDRAARAHRVVPTRPRRLSAAFGCRHPHGPGRRRTRAVGARRAATLPPTPFRFPLGHDDRAGPAVRDRRVARDVHGTGLHVHRGALGEPRVGPGVHRVVGSQV